VNKKNNISQEVPKVLYHYTTAKSLLGIVNDNAIWATNINYFNDPNELKYAYRLVLEEVSNIKKIELSNTKKPENLHVFLSQLFRKFNKSQIEQLLEKMTKYIESLPIYVISLSEKKDHKSQWMEYSDMGNGFCIGFDTKRLCKGFDIGNFEYKKCIYDLEEQKVKVGKYLNQYNLLFTNTKDNQSTEVTDKISEFFNDMYKILTEIKKQHFKDEKEWRLVSQPIGTSNYEIRFRSNNNQIIPYISLPFPDLIRDFPIVEIIIGPKQDNYLAKMALAILKSKKQAKGIKITESEIEIR